MDSQFARGGHGFAIDTDAGVAWVFLFPLGTKHAVIFRSSIRTPAGRWLERTMSYKTERHLSKLENAEAVLIDLRDYPERWAERLAA